MYIEISYAYRERALPLVLYDTPEWSPVSLSCLFIITHVPSRDILLSFFLGQYLMLTFKKRFGLGIGPGQSDAGKSDRLLITQERHRKHLKNAFVHLESFLVSGEHYTLAYHPITKMLLIQWLVGYISGPNDVVLGAEELRYAAREIGRIGGMIDVEDVLDSIFREFCIGK